MTLLATLRQAIETSIKFTLCSGFWQLSSVNKLAVIDDIANTVTNIRLAKTSEHVDNTIFINMNTQTAVPAYIIKTTRRSINTNSEFISALIRLVSMPKVGTAHVRHTNICNGQ